MNEERFEMEFEFDAAPDAESAIESVLGENPRASQLQQLISALAQRRAAVLREADKAVLQPASASNSKRSWLRSICS